MSDKRKIKAVIPVRKGSQRVKSKNIRPFAGSSILGIKIEQLKRIKLIDEIIVSSDSDEMLSLATSLGVTALRRDPKYASSTIPANLLWEHIAQTCVDCDDILYTNCTNPLVLDSSYTTAIELYLSEDFQKNYDSLTSVHAVKEYIWHEGEAVNYDPSSHPRSQDLPDYYALNFAMSIVPRTLMISRKNILGEKFFPFYLTAVESIDIDNEDDFSIAEAMYSSKLHSTLRVK